MQQWKEEQLQLLMAETHEEGILRAALSLARQLGFDYLAFGIRTPLATMPPKTVVFNNYSMTWNNRYKEKNYLAIDPTVAHCHNSLIPLLWTDEVFVDTLQFRSEAKVHGLNHGWSQSAHGYHGCESMLTLARKEDVITAVEFYEKVGQTLWLCNLLHSLISAKTYQPPKADSPLSHREIEVLKWSAEGKTAAEIGILLHVSERTVHFHVNAVIRKMNVANKTSAVVQAVLGGWI